MSNSPEFARKGFLTFLSQGALCVGVACATLALPAHAAKPDAKAKPAAASAKKTTVAAKSNDSGKTADKAAPRVERVAKGKADKDEGQATTRVARAGKDDKAVTTRVAARADKAETPAKGKAATTTSKAATTERASTRKGLRQDEDKPVLQVRYTAGGVSKGTAVQEPVARKGKGGKAASVAAAEERPARRLGKAERLQAERLARQEAEELARKQAIEAEREKRLAEAARLERQRELERQRRVAAAKAKREQDLEQDRIATLLAERSSAVREVGAAAPLVASTAPVTIPAPVGVIAPAAVLAAASTAPALSMVPSQPVVATPVAAPVVSYAATRVAAPAVVAAAPAPIRSLAAVTPARVQPEQGHFVRVSVPQRDTLGSIGGLGNDSMMSPSGLHSSVAFVMDQQTGEVLLNKNGRMVSSIASITKLMTAVVIMDANLSMDERITITYDDVDRLKGSSSRLAVGTTLTRQELLHLTLMSSENRAAHALGRTYPGGMSEFVRTMNMRAMMLGMNDTRYVEPTGLNSANRSSARDLALLTKVAYSYPLIRNYTTYPGAEFAVNGRSTRFNNTNRLVHSVNWDIGLQKTGFISEAGRCVVMQSNINGRNVLIVLMDSSSSNKRVEDAEAIRNFVEAKSRGSRGFASTIASRGAVDMAY